MSLPVESNQKKVWDAIWSGQVSYEWDSLSQTIYDYLLSCLPSFEGAQIAEAGSGTGKISLEIAKNGGIVTLIDYSRPAIANSVRAFSEHHTAATFLEADIRDTGLPDARFDLTWNAEVLEHFSPEDQIAILKEMARITKPGGKVVVMTPNAKCLPYSVGKWRAEQNGLWPYGEENPVESLKEAFQMSGITVVEETHIGFPQSLNFLDFIENTSFIKETIHSWYQSLDEQTKSYFPGYLVVTSGKVGDNEKHEQRSSNLEGKLLSIIHQLGFIEGGTVEISPEWLSAELAHSMKKLQQVQQQIAQYGQINENRHHLDDRNEEISQWLPLLPALDRLLNHAGHKQKVLDAKAADGTLLLYAVLSGADGFGLDITDSRWPKQIEQDYDIKWFKSNIEADEIPGSQLFDIILFTHLLEHLNYNPIPVFRKLYDRLVCVKLFSVP